MTDHVNASGDDVAAAQRIADCYRRLREELHRVIVGQDEVIEQLLISLFAGGHCILEGVPGLAKTMMISTLARTMSLSFSRIQFTPDLMPSDITGTEVIAEDRSTGTRAFKFLPGPVFANVVLADEINRTPPKTQAAMLECMQERQVTVGGVRHAIDSPFFVLATQNPIEQEGTYPLPEAQQDRFMFKVQIGYPSYEEELDIATKTTGEFNLDVSKIIGAEEILELQKVVRRVPAAEPIVRYALDLVRATRPNEAASPQLVRDRVSWGAGPRAVQFLIVAAKARAVLRGNLHVSTDDIRALAAPVLRHRVVTNFAAQAEGYTPDKLVSDLLDMHDPHGGGLLADNRVNKMISA
ncbi:MAG: MoxR family ATPase [Phycisphaerales bacterium]|nr:MoxR family ATPase [Phycisphaerales bacterium]MCB9858550.1 MoxR family ATPase [Phycisphaerales bacterium]